MATTDRCSLNEFEFVKVAMANYYNPHCKSLEEFEEDLQRFMYLKKLLNRDDYNPRLVLNHIVVLYNVFAIEACTKLLFCKIPQNKWSDLKTFLVFLNFMPEEVLDLNIHSSEIPLNSQIVDNLREL